VAKATRTAVRGVVKGGAGARRPGGVTPGGGKQLGRRAGRARRPGDDGPVAAVRAHHSLGFELSVGTGDGSAGQSQVVGEVTDRREASPRV
jgi:hypothetical protein